MKIQSSKIKVCCSTYWYPYHEEDIHATYVHDINRFLFKNGCEVDVVTPNYGDSKAYEAYDGVKIHRFDFKVPFDLEYGKVAQSKTNILKKIKRLCYMLRYSTLNFYNTYRLCKTKKINVIHAHWAIPSGFSALLVSKLLKIPCIITMHGGDVYYNPQEGYTFPKLWYVKPFLKYTLNNADMLTAITKDCKTHAINARADKSRIKIVYNGTDTERFKPVSSKEDASNTEKIINEYKIAKQSIFICRQLIPRKGVRFAIGAMPQILKKFPSAKMLIAGDGFEKQELEKLIKDLKLKEKVFLLGWIENKTLPDYYNACSISIIPSLEEGFGIPAVEAMACKKPVIATDAGGLPEVVYNKKTGVIVKKADSEAIAAASIFLFSNPKLIKEYGELGRNVALEKYSWDISAKSFIEIYQELIK